MKVEKLTTEGENQKEEVKFQVSLDRGGNVILSMNPLGYDALLQEYQNLVEMVRTSKAIGGIKLKNKITKAQFTAKYFPIIGAMSINPSYKKMVEAQKKKETGIIVPNKDLILPKK